MQPQIDNKIISSFSLFVDHEIQRQGLAYFNTNGLFYPAENKFNDRVTYTCPYKQLCNDTSISGASIMSGVYLNGNYVSVGQSGLIGINHYDGAVHFSAALPSNTIVSGNFAVKDVNIYLSDQPDYKLIFGAKYSVNPKYGRGNSGVALDAKVAPAVFLVPKIQENRPFSFAGLDDNFIRIRGIVVVDNLYQKIAICNILKNFRLKNLKVANSTVFDYLGNMTGVNYNYGSLDENSYYKPIIMQAVSVEAPTSEDFTDIYKQFAIVDFDISTWATHL